MARAARQAKKGSFGFLKAGFLVLVLLLVTGAGAYRWATGASGPSVPVRVEIPEGATAGQVGELLERAGVIRSSIAFRVAASFRGLDDSLQAGEYWLATNMPLADALDALEAGPTAEEVRLTVPEGYEIADVADAVEDTLGIPAEEFRRVAGDGGFALPPYLPGGSETVEGFLFPETYGFREDVRAEDVILRLLEEFGAKVADLGWDRGRGLGLSPYEVVIVASMIEREARVPADRPKIAAVIYNRLEAGMPLEIDATVQYALPEENRELTFQDYEVDSPYNTYRHVGLPPTPIGSPGLASLEAALDPADAEYLYFVLIDPETGRHAFAETYEEFLRLKERAGL